MAGLHLLCRNGDTIEIEWPGECVLAISKIGGIYQDFPCAVPARWLSEARIVEGDGIQMGHSAVRN
jgi:hypothetical protein